MRLFVSAWSLRDTIQKNRLTLPLLLAFVQELRFSELGGQRPPVIMRVISEVGSEWLGTCVDFGNFPRDENRYTGINLLLERAVHVQAKTLRFNSKGEESSIDYQRCMQLLNDHSYNGTLAVEYEGPQDGLHG